jgi:hypothetical protein
MQSEAEGDSTMRQIGDLLVWMAMVAAVLAVLYLAPWFAHYMSEERRPSSGPSSRPGFAFVEHDTAAWSGD